VNNYDSCDQYEKTDDSPVGIPDSLGNVCEAENASKAVARSIKKTAEAGRDDGASG
jgi:hypothetical protein